MDRRYTALVPRGTPTRMLDRHPSFPDGLPAGLVADPRPRDRCWDCQWLDYMYDTTGDRTYETRLLEHVNARHVRAAR